MKIEEIKRIEDRVEQMFKNGELKGTIHLSKGQEAIDYGIITWASAVSGMNPYVLGNHRSHGQFLIQGGTEEELIDALKKYKGQHLYIKDKFLSTGIQGALTAFAVGLSLTLDPRKQVICFIGDGTLGQGLFYEALGLASLYRPENLTYVIVDNNYSMSRTLMKPNIEGLALAYRMKLTIINEGWDVEKVSEASVKHFSDLKGPGIIYAKCARLCGHSINDTQVYRPKEELTEDFKQRYEVRN